MSRPLRHREPRKCIGEICPERLYTVDRVMECIGVGSNSISDGVAAGEINRIYFGTHAYVMGSDVIAFILKNGSRRHRGAEKQPDR